MQAQLKQEDHPMDAHTCELDATKAELQACREQLDSARLEIQEKAEHVDVMVSYFNDVVEGQLKPQLKEAETTATQLRGEVEALTTELTSVQSQLTNKTKDAQHLDEQVAALTSELEAAKAEVVAMTMAAIAMEDQVAALKIALQDKSRETTTDKRKMEWIWVCIVSLVVAVVVHAWSLLVTIVSWTCWSVMSACWRAKTWTMGVVATDKKDQDVKRERWSVGRMSVVGLLFTS